MWCVSLLGKDIYFACSFFSLSNQCKYEKLDQQWLAHNEQKCGAFVQNWGRLCKKGADGPWPIQKYRICANCFRVTWESADWGEANTPTNCIDSAELFKLWLEVLNIKTNNINISLIRGDHTYHLENILTQLITLTWIRMARCVYRINELWLEIVLNLQTKNKQM